MDVVTLLSIIVTALSTGVSVLAMRAARSQTRKARLSEKQRQAMLDALPSRIVNQLKTVLTYRQKSGETMDEGDESTPPGIRVEFADVNGDGREELIVQHIAGAHGCGVKVFAWSSFDFTQIGELGTGTFAPIQVADFDGDGKLEIALFATDWDTNLPYCCAPQFKVIYKWNGSEFEEAGQIKDYTSADVEQIRQQQGL